MYDLVGTTPEFLVAHRLEPVHLFAWVFVLSVGLPLLLFLIYQLFQLISRALSHIYLGMTIALLSTLAMLPLAVRLVSFDGYLAVLSALPGAESPHR